MLGFGRWLRGENVIFNLSSSLFDILDDLLWVLEILRDWGMIWIAAEKNKVLCKVNSHRYDLSSDSGGMLIIIVDYQYFRKVQTHILTRIYMQSAA